MSDIEIAKHVEAGLETLHHLTKVYDDGHPYIAFTMAVEVRRILTDNSVAVRLRGDRSFTTPTEPTSEGENILAINRLVYTRFQSDPPSVTFVPPFSADPLDTTSLIFRDWWSRDVIYRAGAAAAHVAPGLLPTDPADRVPFRERKTVSRREFVDLLRNKLGAHLTSEMPKLLDDLQDAKMFGIDFLVSTPQGELSVMKGTLPVLITPAAAMMRQIAHEVLEAYA